MDKTILVVDDHHAYAETLVLVLYHHGFRATAVTDSHAVLAHLSEQPPDLIICDVHMPGQDGVTLARRIRELGSLVPILLMCGETVAPVDLPAVSVARKTNEVHELITLVERQFV